MLELKFRLGLFEHPYVDVAHAKQIVHSKEHQQLALNAAREGMVLLKNENNVLPLKKDVKTIAVIGPNANALEVLMGNYNGQPSKYVTPLTGIQSKVSPATKVLYSPGTYKIGVSAMTVPSSALSVSGKGSPTGLKGEYFSNRDMKGEPALV